MKMVRIIGLSLPCIVLLAGAAAYWLYTDGDRAAQVNSEAWFADVTDAWRLDFVHDAGDLTQCLMPQSTGSGVALFDFDGDGRLDLYLLNNAGPKSKSVNRLYKNMPDGTFQDVSEGSGLDIAGSNMGVAIGDVNNDGLPDVLVTQYGGVRLFLNRGGGKFEDVTKEAGVEDPLWASSANFFDYDRDGWLDLVVVNYVDWDPASKCKGADGKLDFCAPKTFRGTATKLFRNLGPGGKADKGQNEPVRFQDRTIAAGLAATPGPGLGVYCADFSGDGWPDIFVANDGQPNHLWINQKNGTFVDEAALRGLALDSMGQAQAGMGVAIGDVNNDGLFDIYVSHLGSERNTLWLQDRLQRGFFSDRTGAYGLLASKWRGTGFGTLMADFNQDGWLDIAVVNGRVARGTATPNPGLGNFLKDYSERNQLFRNRGDGKFEDISTPGEPFCAEPNVARGLAAGDLDGDGARDLVVTTIGGRARIYRNVCKARGHWLLVQALDPRYRRDAYGAEVRVRAGDREWLRVVNPGDSYLSSSDPRVHFGLGEAARYDAIRVRWPDGQLTETFPAGDADRIVVLRRGEGQAEAAKDGARP
jgi:hypothetical protein